MNKRDLRNPFGEPVYYKETTESTMTDMVLLNNASHGTVILTDYQSKGRGRGRERSWDSSKGLNLLFTITLSPEKISHPLMRIPLISGLALTNYLREIHKLEAMLKWPNDVLVDDKKIAGILCEYRGGKFLLGMGINCEQKDFSPDIAGKTASLSLLGISNCRPAFVLEGFLIYLKQRLENQNWKKDALLYLYKRGQVVTVCEGPPEHEKSIRIIIEDLSEEGFLVIREIPHGKTRQISTGEIRFTDLNTFSS